MADDSGPATDRDTELRGRRDRALIQAAWSGSSVRVLVAVVGAVTVGLAVRSLGDEQYGVVATLATMVGLLGFADFGVGLGLLTMLARAHGEDDPSRMRGVVSSAWAALLGIGAVVTVLFVALALVLPWQDLLGADAVPSGTVRAGVVVFALAVGLAVPATIGARVLLGLQRGAIVSAWQLVAAVATLGSVALCALLDAPLPAYVAATIGVPTLVNGVQSVWVLRWAHADLAPRFSDVRRATMREVVGLSGVFLGLNIAVAFAFQTDAIIVAAVLGASSAAVFAVSRQLFTLVLGLFSGASQQMWPALAEAMTRGDLTWARTRFVRVAALGVGGSALVSVVLVLIGPWVIRIWVGESLVPSRGLLLAFAVWTVYSLGMGQASLVLNAARVVRPQLVMAVLMAAANIPLSIYLTREIGLAGPLIGSLIAHVCFAGVPTIVFVRRVLWPPEPTVAA